MKYDGAETEYCCKVSPQQDVFPDLQVTEGEESERKGTSKLSV